MTVISHRIVENIKRKRLSIYDPIPEGDPNLWFHTKDLETYLNQALVGFPVPDVPIRTRSKIIKTEICRILGYEIPASFKKTKPRFPGQNFDTYSQVANNLQIWNDEIEPNRRYVIISISPANVIDRVKIILGDELARLDTTGTLTQKYQARLNPGSQRLELVSNSDTHLLLPLVATSPYPSRFSESPISLPQKNSLLPIKEIYSRLSSLVGRAFPDAGMVQERNRGSALHRLVCERLGYSQYQDSGQFPDVTHQ